MHQENDQVFLQVGQIKKYKIPASWVLGKISKHPQ